LHEVLPRLRLRAFDRKAHAQAFEHFAHGVDFEDLGEIEPRDDRAAVWNALINPRCSSTPNASRTLARETPNSRARSFSSSLAPGGSLWRAMLHAMPQAALRRGGFDHRRILDLWTKVSTIVSTICCCKWCATAGGTAPYKRSLTKPRGVGLWSWGPITPIMRARRAAVCWSAAPGSIVHCRTGLFDARLIPPWPGRRHRVPDADTSGSKSCSSNQVLCFTRATTKAEKVARLICHEWTMHTRVEEEIFYPEARAAIDNPQIIDDAEADRAMASELIAQIMAGSIADKKFAARVGMLAEYVNIMSAKSSSKCFPGCDGPSST